MLYRVILKSRGPKKYPRNNKTFLTYCQYFKFVFISNKKKNMISGMINIAKKNLFILIIILILGSYLTIKASNENGWDGWGFGSAQTLMSGKYWAKDGFAKSYFLFIASPYSKLIHYLDSEEFRTRKIEDINGALIRNRIYYTHYPPLYAFPYALITKIDFENRAAFRIFSLIISLAALFLFYLFIKSISTKAIALIASIYYGFSVTFLNYADAISVQPWTILFTFLILNLSISTWRNYGNLKKYKKYNLAIWICYLALSLSSYDATFFVFAYLIFFDILIAKKFFWRKWLFFASAPIFGFLLQILQNGWYLGWAKMWQDIYNSYTGRALGSAKGFALGLITPFVSITGFKTFYFFKKTILALGSASLIFGILWKLKSKIDYNPIFFRLLLILAVSAIIQPFFINVTGHWPYQGVLTAPFWGLLLGASSVFLFEIFKKRNFLIFDKKEKKLISILLILIISIWLARFYDTYGYVKDWPNNQVPKEVMEFSKTIKNIYPGKEKMAFRILPQNPIWKSQFPVFNFEYYLGILKLDFVNTKDLLTEFWWLRNISKYQFYSFVISENRSDVEKIRQKLLDKKIEGVSPIIDIQGQYLFTVDPK